MTDQTNKDLPEFSLDRHDLFDLSIELLGVIEDVKNGMPFDDVCMETIISVRERLVCLDALSASAPAAGSAPSDAEIMNLWRASPWPGNIGVLVVGFARALLAQYGSSTWQPIETAPKDGEVVLVRGHEFGNANLPRFVALATYIHGEFHNEEGAQVKPDQWMRIDAEN